MIRTSKPIDYVADLVEQFRLGYTSLDEMWGRLDEFLQVESDPIVTHQFSIVNRISTCLNDYEKID